MSYVLACNVYYREERILHSQKHKATYIMSLSRGDKGKRKKKKGKTEKSKEILSEVTVRKVERNEVK